ncbi:MAG: cyclic nucleotide-binding domain-containing protein [Proteobacteria bacterium]|nr:cyclic nucleotide-binding domain-containing protein [Pseudomonadota bacterium]
MSDSPTRSHPESHGHSGVSSSDHGASGFAPPTALERAWADRAAGQRERALRLALTAIEGRTAGPWAALLVVRLLLEARRDQVASRAIDPLVTAFIDRGDLPGGVVAAGLLAAERRQAALRRLAQAFARGSERVTDAPVAPPPLPDGKPAPAEQQALAGEPLLGRAEQLLQLYLSLEAGSGAPSRLPRLALFGSLSADALVRLLGILGSREIQPGANVVREGEPGREAFVLARGRLQVVRQSAGEHAGLANLGPGDLFGEMALVSDAPRAASVIAATASEVLVASRERLEELAGQEPALGETLARFCQRRMLQNLVRHSPILSSLQPKQREQLMGRFKTCHFGAGRALITQGSQAPGLYLIASGEVSVCSPDEDGDTVVLAVLGPGDVVGEISLVLRREANASVVATHPTVALELTHEQFQHSIREHPNLLARLYEIATQRDEETRSVVAQRALDVEDVVLV